MNCWFWICHSWLSQLLVGICRQLLGCKEKSAAQGRVQELCQVKEHQFVFESGGADISIVFVLFVLFVFVFVLSLLTLENKEMFPLLNLRTYHSKYPT